MKDDHCQAWSIWAKEVTCKSPVSYTNGVLQMLAKLLHISKFMVFFSVKAMKF